MQRFLKKTDNVESRVYCTKRYVESRDYRVVQKWYPVLILVNFRECRPILTIFSVLDHEIYYA